MFLKYAVVLFLFLKFSLPLWAQNPPVILAEGDQIYCPQTQIPVAERFEISGGDASGISELFLQISTGYILNEDKLKLTNSHPKITASWNAVQGKLTLSAVNGLKMSYNDVVKAVQDVVFESSSASVSGFRLISFSIGNANYLPSTGHYYEFVAAVGITWEDAKIAAASRKYYGLQGYLATISSAEESQLAGEQASGAGWIGGTDEVVEGVWKWATGPEAGQVFWNGGINGAAPPGHYANWNTGEPNNLGDENYAHITAPGVGRKGSWNDLSNTGAVSGDYQPKGYIVEYGGNEGDPVVDLAAYTKITVNPLFEMVQLPTALYEMNRCDDVEDGDPENGFSVFDLTTFPLIYNDGMFPSGVELNFYSDSNYLNIISNPSQFRNTVKDQQTIYLKINSALDQTCFIKSSFNLKVLKIPEVPNNITYKNCDADGLADGFTDFNLDEISAVLNPNMSSDFKITYYFSKIDATNNLNSINNSIFNNTRASTIFARVENGQGCFALTEINLEVSTTSVPANAYQKLEFCDDDGTNDGIYTFNLEDAGNNLLDQLPKNQNLSLSFYEKSEDALLNKNKIQNITAFRNSTPYSQTLFVRVQSETNGDCYAVGSFIELVVNPLPEVTVQQFGNLCNDGSTVILKATDASDTSTGFIWTDLTGQIIGTQSSVAIAQEGRYTVTAISDNNCESTPVFYDLKASEKATLNHDAITINDLQSNNSLSISTSGLGAGNYEFALDHYYGPYQDVPLFENLSVGPHTLYVKDKNGCGISQLKIAITGFSGFFTPNNDGYNDYWNIKAEGLEFLEGSYIQIFNRFGTLLATVKPGDQGWNGKYNNADVPADDYWFSAYLLTSNGEVRQYRGHFSLIR